MILAALFWFYTTYVMADYLVERINSWVMEWERGRRVALSDGTSS